MSKRRRDGNSFLTGSEREMSKNLKAQNDDRLKLVVCTPQIQRPATLDGCIQQMQTQTLLKRVDADEFSDIFPLIEKEEGALVFISVLSK